MINNYTMYTARELRNGLGRIKTFFGNLATNKGDHKEKVFNNLYTEIVAEKDMDKIEYLYFFITRMAWLSQEVTNQDDLHFKKEEK